MTSLRVTVTFRVALFIYRIIYSGRGLGVAFYSHTHLVNVMWEYYSATTKVA